MKSTENRGGLNPSRSGFDEMVPDEYPFCDRDVLKPYDDPRSWQTHPITGEFLDKTHEESYLIGSIKERLHDFTILALPASVFFLLGVLVDYLTLGSHDESVSMVVLVCGIIAAIILASIFAAGKFRENPKIFDWLLLLALLLIGAAVCVFTRVVGGSVFLHAQTGLVLLFVFYIFVPIRLIFVFLASTVFSFFFLMTALSSSQIPDKSLFQIAFYFIMLNILGAIFAREQQRARRRVFAGRLSECRTAEALRREMAIREDMERIIAEKELRFRSLVELAPDAILVHRHGRVLYVNPQAVRLLGGKLPSDVIGRSLFDYIVSQDVGSIAARMEMMEQKVKDLAPLEIQVRTFEGKTIDCEVVSGAILYSGEPAIQSVVRNISDRKRMSRELLRLATTDSLTGIFNRRKFFEEMEREWSRARRHSRPLSLIMFDVDFFKSVNDTYGHAVGDEVLRRLVAETARLLRSEDIFCRLGGEEFGILLPEVTLDGAQTLAERIRKVLEEMSVETVDGEVQCTVSIGVAACRLVQESMDQALKRVDDALYEAKRMGRNRVEVA